MRLEAEVRQEATVRERQRCGQEEWRRRRHNKRGKNNQPVQTKWGGKDEHARRFVTRG